MPLPVIIIILVVIVFFVLFPLVKIKNTIVTYLENIKKLKSNVRIKKANYLQSKAQVLGLQKNVTKNQGEAISKAYSSVGGGFLNYNASNIKSNFVESQDYVRELSNQFQYALTELVDEVNNYNTYISKFPRSIIAMLIYRAKKADYVEESTLDNATTLSGFDDDEL